MSSSTTAAPLAGCVVVDLSSGISGAYCTKLLADAGATVVKLESGAGDRLRSWSATGGAIDPDRGGALFQFLACSKDSVAIDADDPRSLALASRILAASDVAVWSAGSQLAERAELAPQALRERLPHLCVASITPFGLHGPWADPQQAATEFTVQAWSGAIGHRGVLDLPPVSVGGRVAEWAAGVYAAIAVLAARRRGGGDLLDVAWLDVAALTLTNMHPVPFFIEAGGPREPERSSLIPGIHPTRDGWVGFMAGTAQQWMDFCLLIERFDWLEDQELIRQSEREVRRHELTAYIDGWTSAQTTEEVVERASMLRIPVAPVGTGATAPTLLPAMFTRHPASGVVQPITPYRLLGVGLRDPEPSPALGEQTAEWARRTADGPVGTVSRDAGGAPRTRPFEDLRIVDLTAFWAGPSAAQFYGFLGAEVIKVESPARPDGIRALSTKGPDEDRWWEYAPLFRATNTEKLGFGLRLDRPQGLAVLRELLDRSDVLIENFSPRVLDGWGLDFASLHRTNPRLIVVRMPAFGLAGPWRDRTGFAQTMEQVSGMAWITGFPEGRPVVPNGPCDPLAGAHAAFALEVALAHRERTGLGTSVEVPMVLSALNVAAEQVVEHSAYGSALERVGNRGRTAVPQNLYRTGDADDGVGGPMVAIAVETDEQWVALVGVLDKPDWALDDALATVGGRRAAEHVLDAALAAWCAQRSAHDIVALLWPAGIPVGKVLMPHAAELEQLSARGFFEPVDDPVVGSTVVPGLPVRFESIPGPLHRRPAPRIGEHNSYVLRDVLGFGADRIAALEGDGTIGTGLRPD